MRRPLAAAGGVFFFAMPVAVRLPARWQFAAAAVLAAVFVLSAVFLRRRAGGAAPLAAGAAAAAFLVCGLHGLVVLRPLRALPGGKEREVTARVADVRPGYGGDTVNAELEILDVRGGGPAGFSVSVQGLPRAELGEVIRVTLRFSEFSPAARASNYARGFYLSAAARSAPVSLGVSHTLSTRMRALQYAASANVRGRLPLRLAGVMAAMSVGDRRYVPAEATAAYRAAGVSHTLVVSGLHLSLLCGFIYPLLSRAARRKKAASLCVIAFVLLFMAFTGLTPSILRSGVVYIFLYAAPLFSRRADVFTSLGAAAVVLLLQNPYACADIGLQLSFTATLGAVGGGALAQRLRSRGTAGRKAVLLRLPRAAAQAAAVPLCVTAATLPVVAASGLGLSVFTVPMNIIIVPLVTPIVLAGLICAIPPALPILGLLGLPAAFAGGALLSFLEWLTGLCASFPAAVLPVGGGFALAVIGALYAAAFAGAKLRRHAAAATACVLLAALAFALHAALDSGTVRVYLAGSGPSSSLVVIDGGQAAVLYRGRQTRHAVSRVLQQNGISGCALFIDMRKTDESTEYYGLFSPKTVVSVFSDGLYRKVYSLTPNVTVSLVRQGEGAAACVDVGGYKIGVTNGSVNLEPYAPLDLLSAGGGEVRGEAAALLLAGDAPDWRDENTRLVRSDGAAEVWIRPGKSVIFREVRDGTDE